jgi:bilirubin oxidase
VEPRKYKFRILDASISRSYKLYLVADNAPNTRLPFTVVGADAGYLDHRKLISFTSLYIRADNYEAVPTDNLVIAMAERYEVVIDFAAYAGQNLTLKNEQQFQTNEDYPATDRVLRFVVGNTVKDTSNNGPIPAHLADLAQPADHPTIDHSFTFERTNGQWLINGVGFEDIPNRILAFPAQGRVQRWELINKSGGWSHPIHIHLIDFRVDKRTGGRGAVTPYEAAALKDVVYLGTNERVEVIANYAPWSGVYMFHCHNLVHEDHDMMAAFNVSKVDLTAFGYPETVTFGDPMTPQFRAKPYSGHTDLDEIKEEILPGFDELNAYPDTKSIENDLNQFWATAKTTFTDAPVTPTIRKVSTTATSSVSVTSTTLSTVVTTSTTV